MTDQLPEYGELWKQVASPGDAAVFLLAGAAGFVADAGLNIVGFFSPGVVGVTAASSALGAKKAWDANRLASKERKRARTAAQRAGHVVAILDQRDPRRAESLRLDIDFHKAGVITDEQLSRCVDDAVDANRSNLLAE
jgi:hypothetical protein